MADEKAVDCGKTNLTGLGKQKFVPRDRVMEVSVIGTKVDWDRSTAESRVRVDRNVEPCVRDILHCRVLKSS